MNTERMEWIAVGLSIGGILLNAWKVVWCWPVWLLSNVFWIYFSVKGKRTPQLVLWIVFAIFNLYGWYEWLK